MSVQTFHVFINSKKLNDRMKDSGLKTTGNRIFYREGRRNEFSLVSIEEWLGLLPMK